MALGLKFQRDEAKTQKDEAIKQTGIAKAQTIEADKQTGIAKAQTIEADKQTAIAKGHDYAAALGGSLRTVEQIADAGLLGGGNPEYRFSGGRTASQQAVDT